MNYLSATHMIYCNYWIIIWGLFDQQGAPFCFFRREIVPMENLTVKLFNEIAEKQLPGLALFENRTGSGKTTGALQWVTDMLMKSKNSDVIIYITPSRQNRDEAWRGLVRQAYRRILCDESVKLNRQSDRKGWTDRRYQGRVGSTFDNR